MNLFALLGLPAFAVLAFAVDRWLNPNPSRGGPALSSTARTAPHRSLLHLLWGVLYAVPCFFLARLLAGIFPQSYRPFLLYLKLLAQDHLFQFAFLTLAGFSLFSAAAYRELAFFAAGYLSLIGFAESLASAAGERDAYRLFLLPVARMALLLLWPALLAGLRERIGRERLAFIVPMALIPLIGAAIGWLFVRRWVGWAGASTAALLFGSVAWFLRQRAR